MANISEQIKTIKNTTHDEDLRDAIAEALTVLADADQSDAVRDLKDALLNLSEKLDSKANSSDVTRIKLTSEEINKLNELKSAINDISRQMSLKANTSDVNKLKKELDGKADSTEVSRALSLKADSTTTKSMMNLYSGDGQSALKAAVEEYATETVVNLLRSYTNEQLNLKEDRSRFDAIVGNGFQGWTITDYIIRIREDYNTALAEMMTRSEFRTMKAEALEQASNIVSVNDEMDDTTRLYLDIEEESEDVELAEMSDLNALASKYDKYFTFNAPLVFELGTLDEHGWNATSTVHIRTKDYLEARDFTYTIGSTYSVQVASYDEYKMLLNKSAWLSGNVSFDIDNITGIKYTKLVVKRNDDANITSAMLNTFSTSANTNHLTMFGTDYIGDGEESVASSSLVATKADKDDLEKATKVIAPTYDPASTYSVGDYVTYGGKLYRCSTAISTAEDWTAGHWTESNVGGEISDLKDDLSKIVIGKSSLENGAFGGTSGKVESAYRIRIIKPIRLKKGTELIVSIGTLYWMIWEMSSSATTGGNIIVSKSWGDETKYFVKNDCYIMISFSKTLSGATESITIDDFKDDYYIIIQRVNESAVTYTSEQSLLDIEKSQARANIDAVDTKKLSKMFVCNLLNPDEYIEGTYAHNNPSNISHGNNTKCVPKIRILDGLTYTFKNVYAYFCSIIYDDGNIVSLADYASPATTNVIITANKNGYAYVTVNNGYYDSAMVVEGYTNYSGEYFTGYYSGLVAYPVSAINANNYATHLPTLASAKDNTIYHLVTLPSMTVDGTMTDVPAIYKEKQINSLFANFGNVTKTLCTQFLFIPSTGEMYSRYLNEKNGINIWTEWKSAIENVVRSPKIIIGPSNYATLLPSLDDLNIVGLSYAFICTKAMLAKNGGLWENVPKELERGQCVGVITTFGMPSNAGTTQIMYLANHGKTYIRYYNNKSGTMYWTPWKAYMQQDVIVAADGSGDYESLTEAILYATQFKHCHVYVKSGTYDIIQEFIDLYGDDFFTNYDNSSVHGIMLYNDIVIEFSPNAYVICEYQGDNAIVQNIFSPFNASLTGGGGFTLINCNLTSRNVRYSVHDEHNYDNEYYHNKYIGCHFNHDKGSGAGYRQCIGGGLGENGLIEIENCIFENPSDTGNIVSWHNCRNAGSRSQIFIKNSIVRGGIRFSYYGESNLVSTMMVTGCKMLTEPIKTQETSTYSIDNVEIIAFNNTIG